MKLRPQFWKHSKELVGWCTDNELKVLIQMASKELESRYSKAEKKYLTGEIKRGMSKRK